VTISNKARAERAQERAEERDLVESVRKTTPPDTTGTRLATDYIHTTHPDTGLDVVFVPGEAVPDWVTA
jgi:hypothetical protein